MAAKWSNEYIVAEHKDLQVEKSPIANQKFTILVPY